MKKYIAALCLLVLLGCGPAVQTQYADIVITSKSKDMLRNRNVYYVIVGDDMYSTDAENYYTMEIGKKYRVRWDRSPSDMPKYIWSHEEVK